jgi:long-chain acyl-CoA synthetase
MEPLIGQAVVVGDGRKYLVALLTLDADDVSKWADEQKSFGDMAAVVRDPALLALVDGAVERVNREHAPVEQIKRWRLLPEPLTVDRDELTPTMKVRRPVVTSRYADLIEEMYADEMR